MSLRAMLWALNDAPVDDPTEALVLVGLADNARDDGTGAWPSQALLAKRARCSVSTVKRALRRLEQRGVIRRGEQSEARGRPDRRPVVYDLCMLDARPVNLSDRAPQPARPLIRRAHDRSRVTEEPNLQPPTNRQSSSSASTSTGYAGDAKADEHRAAVHVPRARYDDDARAERRRAAGLLGG